MLTDVTLPRANGPPIPAAWLTIRPTLTALVRGDRRGRPWHVSLGVCGGVIAARVDAGDGTTVVVAEGHGLDLAACPPITAVAPGITGRAHGTARLQLRDGVRESGDGTLDLDDAVWALPVSGFQGLDRLRAGEVKATWRLAGERLALEPLELSGPDLVASGRVSLGLDDRTVDARLTVQAGAEAPAPIRRLLFLLPPAPDDRRARVLVVQGATDAPHVVLR